MQPALPLQPAPLPPAGEGPYLTPDDRIRLGKSTAAVLNAIKDGKKRTLREISEASGCPEGSVRSRLSNLRQPAQGLHDIQKERVTQGLWVYWLRKPSQG